MLNYWPFEHFAFQVHAFPHTCPLKENVKIYLYVYTYLIYTYVCIYRYSYIYIYIHKIFYIKFYIYLHKIFPELESYWLHLILDRILVAILVLWLASSYLFLKSEFLFETFPSSPTQNQRDLPLSSHQLLSWAWVLVVFLSGFPTFSMVPCMQWCSRKVERIRNKNFIHYQPGLDCFQ